MNKKKLAFFKDMLVSKMESLQSEAERTVGGLASEKEKFPDPTDWASLETHRNYELRIRDRERKLINKIRMSLKKIEEGTFGICEECGEKISEERLKVRPFTSQCINCKTELEERERRGII